MIAILSKDEVRLHLFTKWKEARKLPRGSEKRAEAFRAILIREALPIGAATQNA
jgi:hypothetical protein